MLESTPPMPAVSTEWMEWLKRVQIPTIFHFEEMTGESALKQVGYTMGFLGLKAVIYAKHQKNQEKSRVLDASLPNE